MSELSNISIGPACALRAPGQTALDLTNAELLSSAILGPRLRVQGTIRLAGARIHGTLELHELVASDPERQALVSALGAIVDSDTDLRGMRATGGRIRFANATLGSLIATGAQLSNPGDFTLSLHQATVNGSVALSNGFSSEGTVILSRSTIQGRLECNSGSFNCPPTPAESRRVHAIEAISATIRGGMDLDWAHVSPSVDFTNTATTFLVDDPGTWPPRFAISGFTYDRFDQPRRDSAAALPAWDHAARCSWLARQLAYDAGPYEQAARVFRQHGYVDGAKAILIAQRQHARRTIGGRWALPKRAIDTLYSITVGYGYRPIRVLWLLVALITLVTGSLLIHGAQATMRTASVTGTIYGTRGPVPASSQVTSSRRHTDECGDGLIRCFNPLLYAIDTVVPLVSLDQRSTWYPDAHVRYGTLMEWWLNAASILGWLLSTVFVLSLASLARSL